MESLKLTIALALAGLPAFADAQALPPHNAMPGECYAKVLKPAPFVEKRKRVMTQEASHILRVEQAVFEAADHEVMIEEASVSYEITEPVYEWVEEVVTVAPERKVLRSVPATFKTVKEKVLMAPGRVEWKPGRGAYERIDETTGEILCRVEVPAVYKPFERRVIDKPARIVEEIIPAKTQTLRKRILKTPASMKRIDHPAKIERMRVERLVSLPKVTRLPVDAIFGEVMEPVREGEESVVWEPILCETNVTPALVMRIQEALNAQGFAAGKPDGVLGRGTLRALEAFQREKGLATGGMTIEAVKALGVTL